VGETVVVSAYAYEFLGAIVVRRKFGVDWPIITEIMRVAALKSRSDKRQLNLPSEASYRP
jgi:hypothetical protein